jgi:uncharacterized protein YigE (DUF2233 family)
MKNNLFAILLTVSASCNSIPPDTYPTKVTSPEMFAAAPKENPLVTDLRQHGAQLRAAIDAVDALTQPTGEADDVQLDLAQQTAILGDWQHDAAQYRAQLDGYLREAEASDSSRKVSIYKVDSLSAVVSVRHRQLLGAIKEAEIQKIDAQVALGASFRYQGGRYSAIKVNPKELDIHMHWKNAAGEKYQNISALKQDLEKHGDKVVMITNAGMYNPDNSPQGLFIEKGKQLVPLDTASGPAGRTLNFYLMPNGVFYIDNNGPKIVVTKDYPTYQKGIRFATQSGPMLMIDGQVHPKFTQGSSNTNIRSGVGITADHQVVFAISDRPVNFYDFALLFRDALHCPDALYLDGAISLMYLPHSKRMDTGGDFGPILSVTKRK